MEIARDFSACAQECFYGVLMGRVYFYDVTFCKERNISRNTLRTLVNDST